MTTSSAKGSILVAFIFIIVLTLTAASYLIMISGRGPLTSEQLKRGQAVNYAEAALYETFNRFRYWVNTGSQIGGLDWDPTVNFTSRTITIDTVPVTVSYTIGAGPTGEDKISAKVRYKDIRI